MHDTIRPVETEETPKVVEIAASPEDAETWNKLLVELKSVDQIFDKWEKYKANYHETETRREIINQISQLILSVFSFQDKYPQLKPEVEILVAKLKEHRDFLENEEA